MDELTKIVGSLSARQKITIAITAFIVGLSIFGLTRWRRESDFRVLYSSLAAEDAAGVVQKLKESGVEYRLTENGASILVPSARLADSRLTLAAAGLPRSGRIGFELFDKSNFGATEFVEHINYRRAMEGELERSVMSLAEVEQARVHITLPKESVYLDSQQPAKASVMLKIRLGARISPQNTAAIAHLIASAVEGLSPESVSVLDMNGNLLSRPRKGGTDDASQIPAEALELRQRIERDLVAKISTTLEPLLGTEKFRAGASVECDLNSGEQTEETFDPTKSVMVSSQKSEDSSDRGSTSGVPGTASSLPRATSQPETKAAGLSRRTENVTFQTSRLVRLTRMPQGAIKRMSLSILVDQDGRWEGQGSAMHRVAVPPSPERMKAIRDVVAGVTGFNEQRGDQLIVESLPFESNLNMEPPVGAVPAKPGSKEWTNDLLKNRNVVIAIAAGILLLFVLLFAAVKLLKRARAPRQVEVVQQIESPAIAADLIAANTEGDVRFQESSLSQAGQAALAARTNERIEMAERVRETAQKNPAVSANVLRMWLQESARQAES
ncbi:MAG: flagellar basal-body MS-ring/collar protein FliF [Bryobacteraceae bacterium]